MEEKRTPTPKPPPQLHPKARTIYRQLYAILIMEDRADDKFKYSVAVAANSLYFYKLTIDTVKITDDMSTDAVGIAIRALNSASMEWSRAAKVLLLTPEAELKLKAITDGSSDSGDAPPTLADMMGEMLRTKTMNDKSYGKKNPQSKKKLERGAKTKRTTDGKTR